MNITAVIVFLVILGIVWVLWKFIQGIDAVLTDEETRAMMKRRRR